MCVYKILHKTLRFEFDVVLNVHATCSDGFYIVLQTELMVKYIGIHDFNSTRHSKNRVAKRVNVIEPDSRLYTNRPTLWSCEHFKTEWWEYTLWSSSFFTTLRLVEMTFKQPSTLLHVPLLFSDLYTCSIFSMICFVNWAYLIYLFLPFPLFILSIIFITNEPFFIIRRVLFISFTFSWFFSS